MKTAGAKTLRLSVLMSAPGPLVVGLGLLTSSSVTQMADFVRRSAELLAIIMSFVVYENVATMHDEQKKRALERAANQFVGAMMCVGGAFMIFLTLTSEQSDKGNVIPGLIIALLGVIANAIFWYKYARLNRLEHNAILFVQARLYRAKTLVDSCVTMALLSIVIAPNSPISSALDVVGSLIVALYLMWCGVRTIYEARAKKERTI